MVKRKEEHFKIKCRSAGILRNVNPMLRDTQD